MDKAISTQHPAVVLRSHFNLVRALLAVAMIAVTGLAAAVVIVANDGDEFAGTTSANPVGSINYGGFNPATGRPESAPLPQSESQAPVGSTRYDGGPEEGSRGPVKDYSQNSATGDIARIPTQSPDTRYDGGPEEGTRGPGFSTD
jgi:hypothetical protein